MRVIEQSYSAEDNGLPTFSEFFATMRPGRPKEVIGVYADNLFALDVVQQPEDNCAFVDESEKTATQFSLADKYGVTGLLAHNYKSGKLFYRLEPGQMIYLIYGDRRVETYQIDHFHLYRALDPENPYTKFIDLDQPDVVIENKAVFETIYFESGVLVFQTCIEIDGIESWGRFFAVAKPIS